MRGGSDCNTVSEKRYLFDVLCFHLKEVSQRAVVCLSHRVFTMSIAVALHIYIERIVYIQNGSSQLEGTK